MSEIHQIISGLTYAENFYIALYDQGLNTISFPYIVDVSTKYIANELAKLPIETINNSLTGYMLRTGKMLHADSALMDSLEEKDEINILGDSSHEWLGFPLKKGNKIHGALVVQSYDPKIGYSDKDIELLAFVSQHVATALSRKQSDEALHRARNELELRVKARTTELATINLELKTEINERRHAENLMKAFYKIAELATTNIELNQFYKKIHQIVSGLMTAENFYIALLKNNSTILTFPYFVDLHSKVEADRKLDSTDSQLGMTERVLKSGEALLIDPTSRDINVASFGMASCSWVGVPLKDENEETIGVLAVQSYDVTNVFDDKDRNLLSHVAQHISASLQRHTAGNAIIKAHKELQSANDQLEQRVKERTKLYVTANEELKDNIAERKIIEDKLAHDAFHDALTNLPNRALFLDRLGQAIEKIKRNHDAHFAVLFLDLDRFKIINDSLGHHFGDLLLKEISKRLLDCIRPGDTVARLGGDEFAILLLDFTINKAAETVASRITEYLQAPFDLERNQVFTSASIGISLSKDSSKSADEILRDADTAMYHAKALGNAQFSTFDESMYQRAVKRLQIENALRRALEKNQISVYYQPIIDLTTGVPIAFEALARWLHPEMGWISPVDFIPIAEETELILDIGLFIMEQAISQTKHWQQSDPRLKNMMVSVNLSSKQLSNAELFENTMQIIESTNYDVALLRLEVTESLLIDNFDSARNLLERYSEAGIKILLDDFGTGYSSLSYLHQFPIDVLKVDRSFVSEMEKREENMAIINTIKTLAASLNMEVVAEGIETVEQHNLLKKMKFDYGQGYLFSRPMPADEVALYLEQNLLAD
ncbi:MAG: diguanylate cyclase (GGDEF)-like protein [Enterobacterales bacterium]|jgi:diguanylate cyclase (GGDEF)-like protein